MLKAALMRQAPTNRAQNRCPGIQAGTATNIIDRFPCGLRGFRERRLTAPSDAAVEARAGPRRRHLDEAREEDPQPDRLPAIDAGGVEAKHDEDRRQRHLTGRRAEPTAPSAARAPAVGRDEDERVLGPRPLAAVGERRVRASELAREFDTPLVVYCEETIRSLAQAYRAAAPDALVVFGSKAVQPSRQP